MCGLTGFIDPSGLSTELARRRVEAMAQTLVHRGPDGEGSWVEGPVAFGHRRLSVVDLSEAGAQPMRSACERLICVFNGEIYNHMDLRRELEAAGAAPSWRGQSDTETLLAAIVHWGLDGALTRCHGMFALALWDRPTGRLSLARDRMGEKPLYWGWAGSALVFGSELKAIVRHPDFDRSICHGALIQYVRFGYVPAPRSIYATIYKLEPGSVLEVSGLPPSTPPARPLGPGESYGTLSIRRFWSLADTMGAGAIDQLDNEDEALDLLDNALNGSIKRQSLADVPLGIFLSGGIDSSTIAALAQAQSSAPVATFAVGFEEGPFDESPYAAAVARHLGTRHTEVRLTASDALEVIPSLPDMYDEPFADSSQIPTHLICRAARKQVTVALTGDGADELFGGYNRYLWGPRIWQKLSRVPYPVRRAFGRGVERLPQNLWRGLDWSSRRFGGPRLTQVGEVLATSLQHVASPHDIYSNLVSQWPRPLSLIVGDFAEPSDSFRPPIAPGRDTSCIGSMMMLQDMQSFLPGDILCKVDRAAMYASLETRVPFLDPDVIAIAARLPPSMRFRDGSGKWALRRVLGRYVPDALVDRPKAGFSMPIGNWLRGPLRSWADDLLATPALRADGVFRPEAIQQLWEQHRSGRSDWSKQLWTILMWQSWKHGSEPGLITVE